MADDDQYNNDDGSSNNVCKVYDRDDVFTMLVQVVLAALALLSLYYKRLREHPRRTRGTWFLDVSKQGFGAAYAHVLNMIIANVISQNIRGDSELEDQCAWYGLSYLIDTTLGLLLAVIGLHYLDVLANRYDVAHLKHSGVYAGDQWLACWVSQVLAWLGILTVCKMLIYLFMWVCSQPLAWVGNTLFAPFQGHKHFELLFVMIFFPGVLNVIYFWIADGYLKAADDQTAAHEIDPLEDKKEGLLDQEDAHIQLANNKNYAPAPWSALASGTTTTTTTTTTPITSGVAV